MATPLKVYFDQVKARIRQVEDAYDRLGEVQLLAVSKKKPTAMIHEVYDLGQRHFGESYLQEALDKIKELSYFDDICLTYRLIVLKFSKLAVISLVYLLGKKLQIFNQYQINLV